MAHDIELLLHNLCLLGSNLEFHVDILFIWAYGLGSGTENIIVILPRQYYMLVFLSLQILDFGSWFSYSTISEEVSWWRMCCLTWALVIPFCVFLEAILLFH